jgi:2-haloacid dehalogenase
MTQPSPNAITAVVFDAYGTLYDVHSVIAACDRLWPDKGANVSQLWRQKQLEYTWQRTLMGRYVPFDEVTASALRYAVNALHLPLTESQASELAASYTALTPYAEVRDTLDQLRGKQLAILSNGTPGMLEPLVEASGLGRWITDVISVDQLKVYKPTPRVYQLAVDRLEVDPAQILFVSANGWDACGAKSFGFQVAWINRLGAPPDALGAAPDYIVKSLAELPAIVK